MRTKTMALVMMIILLSPSSLLNASNRPGGQMANNMQEKSLQYDTPQLIHELIAYMKSETERDYDRLPDLIGELKIHTRNSADPVAAAVLHSMTAELYHWYWQDNRWRTRQRTALDGYVPEDIREWPANLFETEIKKELEFSLKPLDVLQKTPVSFYKNIVVVGKDMPELRPTMYDFLSWRALEISPSDAIYRDLIAFRRSQPEKKATLLAELSYLQYRSNSAQRTGQTIKEQLVSLDSLLTVYENYDFSTEIRIRQSEVLTDLSYRSSDRDSANAQLYALYNEAIRRYPAYSRTAVLKNKLADMENPFFNTSMLQTVYPKGKLEIALRYKNIPAVRVTIYENLSAITDSYFAGGNDKLKKGKQVSDQTFSLAPPNTWKETQTQLAVVAPQVGLYIVEVTVPGTTLKDIQTLSVSRLAAVYRQTGSGQTEVLVTDLQSGKPIPKARFTWLEEKHKKLIQKGIAATDENGLAVTTGAEKHIFCRVTLPGDTALSLTSLYNYPKAREQNQKETYRPVSLFTDRGLYRPGQTLYFKGIVYADDLAKTQAVAGENYTVILRDANNKEVATRKVVTNDYGSFSGEFVIPRGLLNGYFSIEAGNTTASVRIEEYKRPTFMLDWQPVTADIAFGDEVKMTGKVNTFSGVALQEGNVVWRVTRRPFLLRPAYGGSYEQVADGTATLSADGTFTISFRPEKDDNDNSIWGLHQAFYTYEAYAMLTDTKGESQEATTMVSVGDAGLYLETNLSERVDKATATVSVKARTINGQPQEVSGNYQLFAWNEDTEEKKKLPEYKEGRRVSAGMFTTNTAFDNRLFANLPSGRYHLVLETIDSKARKVTYEHDFILYSPDDKRPPVYSRFWVINEKVDCLPGETARFRVGSSDKDAYILYELFRDGEIISRERFRLNDENKTFALPYDAGWESGVAALFTYVKEGELYNTSIQINRKQPDRRLMIHPVSFRDKSQPGAKESWSFHITDKDSLTVEAEVLAGMYDASLDQIAPFSWTFSVGRTLYPSVKAFRSGSGMDRNGGYISGNPKFLSVSDYSYSSLDWQDMRMTRYQVYAQMTGTRSASADLMFKSNIIAEPEMLLEESLVMNDTDAGMGSDGMPPPSEGKSPIRQNFNETAFFFPTLRTNASGDIVLNFTLPESNTTWKLQALAHTKDMKYGLTTKEVIASKALMVVPNLPRFVRQGDQVTITTQVLSQSEQALSGRVRLELYDPRTEQPITALTNAEKPFELTAKGQTTAAWTVQIPLGYDLIGCRIVADTNEGSDGEQHLIPVLSDKILVTESTPFYLLKPGQKQIRLHPDNSSSRVPFRLTLEASANPVWYALQALPAITHPDNDNILAWFASYYGNTLAASVVNNHPRIRQVIDRWQAAGGDATTLLSNLEKNEELKDILLEETPWVMEATNETERKQRLSLLFDINRASFEREAALRRLLDEQNPDGGWSWFKGYPTSSRSITLSVLSGMTQLVRLGAIQYGDEEKRMQMNALRFLDDSIRKEYEQLKTQNKEWENATPSAEQLTFLYVRSSYRDIPEKSDAREAIRFYTNQAKTNWQKLSLAGKAQTAMLMHRNGEKATVADILAWLRRTATQSEEMGMYWANNRSGSSFFVSPIEVQVLLMELIAEVSPDSNETDRMKQWLLNQKRTQDWQSTPATMNAIYAILHDGSDWLTEDNRLTFTWDGKTLSTDQGEAATGYLKEVIAPEEKTGSLPAVVQIEKTGEAPSWGAVYNQYFESVDKVNKQTGVLNVEKMLFVEANSGSERQLRPLAAGQPLQVGDRVVVRLTIRTDRTMEYVSLKDLRAGCFEPASNVSGYEWQDGVGYYRSPKDVSENFFFSYLPKGTFVVEYPVFVSRPGDYAGGISTIQCMYAPEFSAHTEGGRLRVGGN